MKVLAGCDPTYCGGPCTCGSATSREIVAECKLVFPQTTYTCKKTTFTSREGCCPNWPWGCKYKNTEQDCRITNNGRSCSVYTKSTTYATCTGGGGGPSCSNTSDCGHTCAANGCNACACDNDYRDPKYNWSSLGCSSDCGTCYCGKNPPCNCSWTNQGCGQGSCTATQRLQTLSCSPSGCNSGSRCVNDSSCCVCGGWSNGACGAAGGCPLGQRRQTRSCSPSGCSTESQCVVDSACNCACTWTDQDCGPTGGCALNRMYQTGVCNYPDCSTTQCVIHPNCVSSCTISLSPSPLTVGLDKSRVLTATVVPQHATVNQVSFVSGNANIASVNPATDNNSPYATAVYGRALGSAQITATATLSPEGSCTAVVGTTVRPTAWFQTQGGDIYSGAGLSNDIPSTADDRNLSLKLNNWPGIITHQDENGVNLGEGFPSNDTANHWLAESKYEGKAYGSFQFFKKKFAMELAEETYGTGRGDLPTEDGVYYAQSSRTLTGNWNVGADRWVVLLVEGDVNVNTNIVVPVGSFLAIAATGNINFREDVAQAQGMFVADGTINTNESNQTFEGQGVFASDGFSLERDFEDARNDTTPIETFIARPDFIMSSYKDTDNNLWWFFRKWQEIAP